MLASGEAVVEPDDIDGAVVGQKLPHLVLCVLPVYVHVPGGVDLVDIDRFVDWVVSVDGVLGVVPVEKRVIKPDLQPLGAKGVHPLSEQVLSAGSVRCLVLRVFRIEEAESLVVFGGDNGVLHASVGRHACPFLGIVEVGVEVFEVLLVPVVVHSLVSFDPLVPGRGRV